MPRPTPTGLLHYMHSESLPMPIKKFLTVIMQ